MTNFNIKKDLETLAKNIKQLRKNNHISKEKMSKILNIDMETMNKIEENIIPKELTSEIFYYIYDYFNIKPSELFSELSKKNSVLTDKKRK